MIQLNKAIDLALQVSLILCLLGCKEDIEIPDNELGLDDRTIIISDSSSFNSNEFAKSFSQIAILENDDEWIWKLTHKVEDKKLISTSQNNRFHGDFGKGLYQYIYDYNDDGVIIKANRERAFDIIDFTEFTFEYDQRGRIKSYRLEKKYSVKTAKVFYNDEDKIIKLSFSRIYKNDGGSAYLYNAIITYHPSGEIKSITHDDGANENVVELSYENSNLHYAKHFRMRGSEEEDVYYDIYRYDNQGRATKFYERKSSLDIDDSESRILYSYPNGKMFAEQINYEGQLIEKTEYGSKLLMLNYLHFYFEDYPNSHIFKYAIKNSYQDFDISKKEYFEGTPNDLNLIGYSKYEILESTTNMSLIEQNFFSNTDTPLFHAIYEGLYSIKNLKWYNTDNVEIDESQINTEWPLRLIYDNRY